MEVEKNERHTKIRTVSAIDWRTSTLSAKNIQLSDSPDGRISLDTNSSWSGISHSSVIKLQEVIFKILFFIFSEKV